MNASQREHEAFMDLLMAGKTVDPGAAQAVQVSRIVEGLYASSESRRPWFFK